MEEGSGQVSVHAGYTGDVHCKLLLSDQISKDLVYYCSAGYAVRLIKQWLDQADQFRNCFGAGFQSGFNG